MTSLTLVRHIAAPPELVFEALTTVEGISAWWGPDAGPVLSAEVDLRIGGAFRARFRMLDGSEHESHGHFIEIDPPRRLVMSWRWVGGQEAEGESRVEIDLRAVGEQETELRFTHALLPDQPTADGHREGWNGALDKLERLFATGGLR
jgi:uncharacterized protein YndB with AHSA1/START domain